MSAQTGTRTIETQVTYAGGRKGPFEQDYEPTITNAVVRTAAMTHFELADSTDASGQQISYKLMHGGDTVDLTKTVGELAKHEDELKMRLVRQVSAG
jgi:hypothetical protein